MSQQENTVMLVYRMVGDRRIPYRLEFDSTMTVVSDQPHVDLLKSQASFDKNALIAQQKNLSASVIEQARIAQAKAQSAAVEDLVKETVQEGNIVKINDPNLIEQFPALAIVDQSYKESQLNNDTSVSTQDEDPSETVEELIRQAIKEGHVIKTSNPKLIEKYPDLAPAQREELEASMQGEVEERTLPDGRVQRVYKPTPADILMGTWVTDIIEENPIPGTDELRAAYFAEVAELQARHEKKGTVCPSCEIGAVMRKWRVKLKSLGFIE